MRLEFGTKIELQREICQILSDLSDFQVLDLSDLSDLSIFAIRKKTGDGRTDRRTDGPTDGRTNPIIFIEMRGRI